VSYNWPGKIRELENLTLKIATGSVQLRNYRLVTKH
jgi:transcriptional regulator with PAS, ATPase and Fis domain